MNYKPGTPAPATGIYWCTVCKLPVSFKKDQPLPPCKNMCGRGHWQLVKETNKENHPS